MFGSTADMEEGMIERLNQILVEIDEIAGKLWKNEDGVYQQLEEYWRGWNDIFSEMFTQMEAWQKGGGEVPLETILHQMGNLEMAFVRKDNFLMADTLKYEIVETINYYKEMLAVYEEQ